MAVKSFADLGHRTHSGCVYVYVYRYLANAESRCTYCMYLHAYRRGMHGISFENSGPDSSVGALHCNRKGKLSTRSLHAM
jgi:hypothetical protein